MHDFDEALLINAPEADFLAHCYPLVLLSATLLA
jgi:hypothetical protein